MSCSKPRGLRPFLAAVLLLSGLGLAGCSGLTPVYGEHGVVQQRLPFAYSKPVTRLDQIVIQELALRLGRSDQPGAPLITITSESGSRELTTTDVDTPREEHEVVVQVSYTIVADGVVVGSGTRSATAGYASVGQVLADRSAADDAAERAARAAAETVRLSILADLATPPAPIAAVR